MRGPLLCLFLSALCTLALSPVDADLPSAELLSKANAFLAQGSSGSIASAIEHFDVVLSRDATDYLTLYKRATAYLAARQTKRALEDLETVLTLTDFDQARLQITKIRTHQGDIQAARQALEPYAQTHHDITTKEMSEALDTLEASWTEARRLANEQKWEKALKAADRAVAIAPQSPDLRQLVAECHLGLLHFEEATGELSRAASLKPSSASIMTRLSLLHYLFLYSDSAVSFQPVKQCLHFDPDSRSCKKLFKSLKRIDKEVAKVRNFVEAQRWASASLALDSSKGADASLLESIEELIASAVKDGHLPAIPLISRHSRLLMQLLEWTCQAQIKTKSRASARNCAKLAKANPESPYALYFQATEHLKKEEYEEAVQALQSAAEKAGNDQDIQEELQKARTLLKKSKNKDYYKVLGVSHDADERTIKKAYRKATLKAHPDKGGSEKQMAAVNEAYEVLSNPELRARFDRGDDPNDTSGQQGFQHSDFGGGGFQAQHVFHQFFQGAGGHARGGFKFTYG